MAYNPDEVYKKYLVEGVSKTAKYFNKSLSWVRWLLTKHNRKLRSPGPRSNKVNQKYFSHINTPSKAYFLGLLAADGCVSTKRNAIKLTLKNEDAYLLEYLREELEAENKVRTYGPYSTFEVSSRRLKSDLSCYGVTPQKTHNLSWPNLKESFYPHYIRGFIDGDGCWFIRNREGVTPTLGLQIASASQDFLKELQRQLTENTGIPNKRPYKIKTAQCYELKYSGNNLSTKIKKYVYPKTMGKFYMTRKHDVCATK